MPPPPSARLRDARTVAALGLAAGITVPAALLSGPSAAARPGAPAVFAPAVSAPASSASALSAPAPVSASAPGAGAAGATGAAGVAPLAAAPADEQPGCGDPDAKEFPVAVRFRDAPGRYAAGGGYHSWVLDLTNTTGATCRALHPVLVLTDRDRRLTGEQIRMEFSEPGRAGAVHRVAWETTDRDEQIGVFGGGEATEATEGAEGEGRGGPGEPFLGFTVPAGETVSVRVRLAFTSDAAPGPVTAHAAVVQRRHQDKAKGGGREDGDWVGDSGEYPFVIADGTTGSTREPETPRTEHPPRPDAPARRSGQPESPSPQRSGRSESPAPDRSGPGADPRTDPGTGTDPGAGPTDPGTDQAPPPEPAPSASPALPDGPGLPSRDGWGRPLPELARTGPASAAWTGAAAGALLLGGTGLLRYARRVRRAHRTAG
ncbi:peptidase [Streptomyces californicus]|uniref:peptidase n=1 Tax=Streptomyces californicus TaxID=67351 RepID=UPI0037A540DB